MALPQGVLDFLNENAQNNGAGQPTEGDDLFKMGALDSFALVDFIEQLLITPGALAGLLRVADVLAQVVDADRHPQTVDFLGGLQRVLQRGAGHETLRNF